MSISIRCPVQLGPASSAKPVPWQWCSGSPAGQSTHERTRHAHGDATTGGCDSPRGTPPAEHGASVVSCVAAQGPQPTTTSPTPSSRCRHARPARLPPCVWSSACVPPSRPSPTTPTATVQALVQAQSERGASPSNASSRCATSVPACRCCWATPRRAPPPGPPAGPRPWPSTGRWRAARAAPTKPLSPPTTTRPRPPTRPLLRLHIQGTTQGSTGPTRSSPSTPTPQPPPRASTTGRVGARSCLLLTPPKRLTTPLQPTPPQPTPPQPTPPQPTPAAPLSYPSAPLAYPYAATEYPYAPAAPAYSYPAVSHPYRAAAAPYPSAATSYPSPATIYPSAVPTYPSAVPTYPSAAPTYPSTVPTYPSAATNYPSAAPNYPSAAPNYSSAASAQPTAMTHPAKEYPPGPSPGSSGTYPFGCPAEEAPAPAPAQASELPQRSTSPVQEVQYGCEAVILSSIIFSHI
ncbi:vegetative cell wall protein gp1-like isoform X1 [Thrips palmi]|uniref:Vegetative cell wall protein gp1-like isoform X1 n=1 Tax=Thrips palmi TaxID=161013 RepID=A0A6P8YJK5_THRPL|nr:vegetative cell wall protein gp1-like isoform X1 [Thrips palmi]